MASVVLFCTLMVFNNRETQDVIKNLTIDIIFTSKVLMDKPKNKIYYNIPLKNLFECAKLYLLRTQKSLRFSVSARYLHAKFEVQNDNTLCNKTKPWKSTSLIRRSISSGLPSPDLPSSLNNKRVSLCSKSSLKWKNIKRSKHKRIHESNG